MARYAILQAFYTSAQWVNLRLSLIAERGNVCEKCKKIIPRSIDIIGHHKIELTPANVSDHMISLNPANILLACRNCHDEIHARFGHRPAKQVFVVYGPPLSGKSTYVGQSIHRGDLVVDMNQLFEAIAGLPAHDKPDALLTNVRAVWSLLIDNVRTRYGKWNTAYVVTGGADKYGREKLADDLGAELVFCEASRDECLSRLECDEDRRPMRAEWVGYIDKWFAGYVA